MRITLLTSVLLLFFSGCIVDVVDQLTDVHTSASGKGVTSVTFDASLCRQSFSVRGDTTDTLIANLVLSLMAHNQEQADRIASNVRLSWQPGSNTSLLIDFPSSDKELISIDRLNAVIPTAAEVDVNCGNTDASITEMTGDVVASSTGGDITVDTKGRISLESSGGDISGSSGLGGSITMSNAKTDLAIPSNKFETVNITSTNADNSSDVTVHIASGAKIRFQLATTNGKISVKYDNISYETGFLHIGDGDEFDLGSGKVVSIQLAHGDITITN
ncbi:MAG: hypothetical protein Q8896_05565 [Bacteroidota bacterium]|nr:hypothetical protein [Bacteroidota bacterium]MDP4237036.1 hypothetical protein [Bacteroidota bacterium]